MNDYKRGCALELHERIRRLRAERGWTQKQLERRSGVPQSTISTAELGKIRPTVDTVRRLAVAFGVSLEALLGEASSDDLLPIDVSTNPPLYSTAPGAGPLSALGVAISVRVPVLRSPVRAGTGGDVPEVDLVGWEYVDAELAGRRLFGLLVRGGCLEPDISPEDVVVYEEHGTFGSGQLVVAVHNGEPLVKFALQRDGEWELRSYHEPPLKVNGETIVYGPVLRVIRQPMRWRDRTGV